MDRWSICLLLSLGLDFSVDNVISKDITDINILTEFKHYLYFFPNKK